jgi:hypothetical protein
MGWLLHSEYIIGGVIVVYTVIYCFDRFVSDDLLNLKCNIGSRLKSIKDLYLEPKDEHERKTDDQD